MMPLVLITLYKRKNSWYSTSHESLSHFMYVLVCLINSQLYLFLLMNARSLLLRNTVEQTGIYSCFVVIHLSHIYMCYICVPNHAGSETRVLVRNKKSCSIVSIALNQKSAPRAGWPEPELHTISRQKGAKGSSLQLLPSLFDKSGAPQVTKKGVTN